MSKIIFIFFYKKKETEIKLERPVTPKDNTKFRLSCVTKHRTDDHNNNGKLKKEMCELTRPHNP